MHEHSSTMDQSVMDSNHYTTMKALIMYGQSRDVLPRVSTSFSIAPSAIVSHNPPLDTCLHDITYVWSRLYKERMTLKQQDTLPN